MAGNRPYVDEELPVEAVVADLHPDAPQQAPAPDPAPQADAAASAADFFVVPVTTLNDIVGYMLERPWREVNHLLRAVEGVRSLDEYL